MKNWLRTLCVGSDETLVGIDIGSHSIKLVQLRKKGSGWDLVSLRSALLPPGAIVEGHIMNFTAVIHCLRDLAQQAGVVGAKCALSISGSSVIVKKLSLPEMTRTELDESIMWEAEQYIPFDKKDVSIDAQILNPRTGQGQMDVLMVAAKKDVVNEYVTCATEAGFRVVIVDLAIFAATNTLIMNGYVPADQTVAFLNVGANALNVGVLAGGQLAFTRDLPYGSAMLTAEIQKHLNVSYDEAEGFKIKGMKEDGARLIDPVSNRVADIIVTEVQRSLDFFVATSIESDINRVLLMGGGGQLPALTTALERRMECPVELVNPLRGVAIEQSRFDPEVIEKFAPSAAVAVGLAMRSEDDRELDPSVPGLRVNLFPKPPQKPKRNFFSWWPSCPGQDQYQPPTRRQEPSRKPRKSDPNTLAGRSYFIWAIILLAMAIFVIFVISISAVQLFQPETPQVECRCVCPSSSTPTLTDPPANRSGKGVRSEF